MPGQVRPIQRAIYNIIGLAIDKHRPDIKRTPFAPGRFDDGHQALIKVNHKYGAEAHNTVKRIPVFVRLLSGPRHEQVVSELRPGALLDTAGASCGIHIDDPCEERFRANWHQEYPAQLRSSDGVVF